MLRRVAAGLVLLSLLAVCPAATAGQTTAETVVSNGTKYPYLLHTPTSNRSSRPAPLVVAVHGCQTTAEQMMRASAFNRVADRERFVVLYPDVDDLGRLQPGPINDCWKAPYPPAWWRGQSDAAAIADMTRAVMDDVAINDQRVYLVGVSAGGLMASIQAAAYPDLYAAVGVVESSAYADMPCFTTGIGIPVELSAQLAFGQMGSRARLVPRFVIGGDKDLAFPVSCVNKALEQGLRTNNLVLSGSQEGPISLEPAAVREGEKPGGYSYTVSSYHDPAGCLIGERWIIHGLAHAWPGGPLAGWADAKAPSGARISWEFLSRYTMRGTAMPCAEHRR
jgi:poly(hydroxyalkanoate) depolymerase family esterase